MTDRLSADDWIAHGLRALSADGPAALKADLLAKALGVSRGSFYWHFKDLAAFKAALLARWQEITTDRVIADLDGHTDSTDRLTALMQRALTGDTGLERAVRAWALQDARVLDAVAEVDALRIDYLISLLTEAGLDQDQAESRAVFIYAANLGQAHIPEQTLRKLTDDHIVEIAQLLQAARAKS